MVCIVARFTLVDRAITDNLYRMLGHAKECECHFSRCRGSAGWDS